MVLDLCTHLICTCLAPFLIFGQIFLMNFRLLLFLVFTNFVLVSWAQDSTEAKVYKAHQIRTLNTDYITIDSTIRPHEYELFNEYHADRVHYYNNGNLAAKGHYKSWELNTSYNLLKGFGDFGYMSMFRKVTDVPLLDVKSPLAELHYMNTYRQGNHFGGYYSQNVNKDWNFYIGFTRTHSQGFYLRQENRYDDFDWSTHYASENQRYKATAMVIWQRTRNEENGGLREPDDFINDTENRRELLGVYLEDSRGTSQKLDVLLQHQYLLFPDDTTNQTGLAVYHNFSYADKYHVFQSTDTFWEDYYFADATDDSTRFNNLYNEGGLKWDLNNPFIQSISAGLFYNLHNYNSDYFSRRGNEFGLNAELNGLKGEKLVWDVKGTYLLGEKSSAALAANLGYHLKKSSIGAYGQYSSTQPNYFEETYFANSVVWNQRFGKNKNKVEVGGEYVYADWLRLKGGYTLLSSWIVMNRNAVPEQLTDDISMVNADLFLRFFKNAPVKLDINSAFNAMLSGEEHLRLPGVSVDSKIFYDFIAIKSALEGQIGVNVKYFSSYNSNAYYAASGAYFLQDDAEIGNFIYANAYAIFKVKTLRLFIALENVLQGVLPYDYFSTPYYPMNDRTFRIGAKWRFFN